MRTRRSLIAAVVGGMLLATLSVAPAHAAPAQADDCDDNYSDVNLVTISDPNPAAGDTVTIAGEGFEPGVTVDILLDTDPSSGSPTSLGTAVIGDFGTPDAGKLNTTATLPTDLADGTYTITVVSQKCSADRAAVAFVVGEAITPTTTTPTGTTGAGTPGAGSLARTGSDRTLSMAGLAIGLLALGGVFVMTGGRRQRIGSRRSRP